MSYTNRAFYVGEEPPDVDGEVHPHVINAYTDVDDSPAVTNNTKQVRSGWIGRHLSSQCGCGNTWLVRVLSVVAPLLLGWLLLVELLGDEALPGGGLFKLLLLVLVAELVGEVVEMMGLPSILGMLITGILMRTTNLYDDEGVYQNIVSALRELALGVILIKAGLGLDPVALVKLSVTVVSLAVCPGLMEAITVALTTHYILGYPWLWGFALGFLLCPISPAVVIPVLLKLKKEGYGEGKGISTLVIAASSLDDIWAISVFSICLSFIFSTGGSLATQVLQGPLDVVVGLGVGVLWGLFSAVIPNIEDEFLVWKRAAMVGGAGLCAILGSPSLGYPGAGPLACITAAFVSATAWRLQGSHGSPSSSEGPVEKVFSGVWAVMEPVLFSLIGAEIDLKELKLETVTWGLLIILASLVIRVLTCSLVLAGGKLNFKEVVFVNLAWLPKATVQAALASQPLDMARKMLDPSTADLRRGEEVLTVAVLSILVTAPLGSIGASLAGPHLLAKAQPSTTSADTSSPEFQDHHP